MKYITIQQLIKEGSIKTKWLIDELIPEGGITIISGDPGSYKTWVIMKMMKSVAEGTSFLNKYKSSKGNVLMIDEENGESILTQRIKMLEWNQNLPIYFAVKNGFIAHNEDSLRDLISFIKKNEIKLICIDSLVRVHQKDENVANQIAEVFRYFNEITKLGVTIILTHHHNKQQNHVGHSIRGSSDILAAVDCHLAVTKLPSSEVKIQQNKIRIAKELEPIILGIVEDGERFNFECKGSPIPKEQVNEDIIVDAIRNGACDRPKLFEEVNNSIGIANINKILKKLVESGKIIKSKGERNKITYSLP